MLDAETKRRIDTARDILVGKVPDPKSQVEQITIALIYKFMDDIDASSEELGGTRRFFSGEFARFGWPKLMRSGLGGHEILNLYAEAIDRMQENPGIPQLFREIFNNAYLPYRDPETLRAFLKVIDEFTYDHSERLGDAFEYLLSVLGSQGDAGQFRTPRHIIDFIVAIVDPKKNETILDPACGTAGFLISSYKHIHKANTDDEGNSTLTPDERGRLTGNFSGYDISPDMVRLSLVNMYLHGFQEPHIFEYDTLTSEERWNEYADVILANPPFMSPKGGIRPHNRFSVKSKRSEVLFVDYMAEHLTPSGRAGIIVPEGIIFQSQNAHKQLRKMLVEEYLVAVVSLPAGVFNPYSGVKTSILILDKAVAKRTDSIAFFKVENDGFDLGAQRRPIDQNDLPQTEKAVREHLVNVGNMDGQDKGGTPHSSDGSVLERLIQQGAALIVRRDKIGEYGEYNLSLERFRKHKRVDSSYPFVPLSAIARIVAGNPAPQGSEYFEGGDLLFIRTSDVGAVHRSDNFRNAADKVNQKAVNELKLRVSPKGTVLFPKSGASTFLNHRVLTCEAAYISSHLAGVICNEEMALPKYVYHLLCHVDARGIAPDQAYPSLRLSVIGSIQIPLPPLEVQREIVAEIEGFQRVIDGARAVIDNYKPHIPIDPDWPMVEIGKLVKPEYGYTAKAENRGNVRFIRITDISDAGTLRKDGPKFITLTEEMRGSLLKKGDILVARTGATYGKTMVLDEDLEAVFASYLVRLRFPRESVNPRYYWAFAQSDAYWIQARALVTGGGQPQFNGNAIKQIKLPTPPLDIQHAIVSEIAAEQGVVEANCELIERFEKKIQAAIGRVWGGDGFE